MAGLARAFHAGAGEYNQATGAARRAAVRAASSAAQLGAIFSCTITSSRLSRRWAVAVVLISSPTRSTNSQPPSVCYGGELPH